jgi:hypothetical protein
MPDPSAPGIPAPVRSLTTSNEIVEEQLDGLVETLEQELNADCLAFNGLLLLGADDLVRDALEARNPKRPKLVVVLETTGGYIEVTQRIAETLRQHYTSVEFIVPNYAMSAGTVLVMSGDAIHMDYYSVLGPIDPQVQRPGSTTLVPALGYLAQYERLIEKSRQKKLTTAEMAFLVEKFDPAELYSYEQARELSITLLKEWLVKYKFKEWHHTRTRRIPVTTAMKKSRAEKIAKLLNNTARWHSHGYGISRAILTSDEFKLEIEDFGAKPDFNHKLRAYYRLLIDYMGRLGLSGVLHWKGKYVPMLGG